MLTLPVARVTALMDMGSRIVGLLGGERRDRRSKGGGAERGDADTVDDVPNA